jgi:hypothetical protein
MSLKTKPTTKTYPATTVDRQDPPHFKIAEALKELVARTPVSSEEESHNPFERANELKTAACIKSAAISGMLAIPPGPMGMLTILPDLMLIWNVQQQLVADIQPAVVRDRGKPHVDHIVAEGHRNFPQNQVDCALRFVWGRFHDPGGHCERSSAGG